MTTQCQWTWYWIPLTWRWNMEIFRPSAWKHMIGQTLAFIRFIVFLRGASVWSISSGVATSFGCVFIPHVFAWTSADNIHNVLGKQLVTVFRLHRIARSSTSVFVDLLLVCYLVNTACAIMNIMTTLIFIIVSLLHAFFLVVPVRLSPSTYLQGLR